MADPPKAIRNPDPIGHSQPARLIAAASVETSFAGPLPPPGLLKGYEEACPGAARIIISLAETQGEHRREIEKKMSDASVEAMHRQYDEARMGQICALIVALAFIGAGVYVAISGHPWPGALLGVGGGGGLVLQAIVTTFVRGRNQPEDDSSQPKPKPNASATMAVNKRRK